MVAAALALENKTAMNYYLQFYLSKDTIKDGVGQIALPTTVKKWLTKDGHWREPGGYHNYPVSKLLESALLLENNGYEVFNKYPQLLQASYAMHVKENHLLSNLMPSFFGRLNILCFNGLIFILQSGCIPRETEIWKNLIMAKD